MAAIAGKKAKVMLTGTGISMTAEATTTTDNKNYQITNTVKRILSQTGTVVVKNGGTPVTAGTYTLNRLNGTVTFATATARTITIDATYLPTVELINAFDCSYTIEADNQDVTVFGKNYILREQGLLDFSGSLSQYTIDSTYQNLLTAGNPVVLEISSNRDSAYDIRAWVILASVEESGSVDGIVEESIEFEGTTDADKRCLTLT
jgi:hypothetical protein